MPKRSNKAPARAKPSSSKSKEDDQEMRDVLQPSHQPESQPATASQDQVMADADQQYHEPSSQPATAGPSQEMADTGQQSQEHAPVTNQERTTAEVGQQPPEPVLETDPAGQEQAQASDKPRAPGHYIIPSPTEEDPAVKEYFAQLPDSEDLDEEAPMQLDDWHEVAARTSKMRLQEPTVDNKQILRETVQKFLKRVGPELEADQQKISKRGKTSDGQAAQPVQTIQSAQPAEPSADQDMGNTQANPEITEFPFRMVVDPPNRWCAAMIRPENASELPLPIGSVFKAQLGYSLRLTIDAGRYGTPEVVLLMKISKGKKAENVPKNASDYEAFKITWRPGVPVNGHFMMDHMVLASIAKAPAGEHPHNLFLLNDLADNLAEGERKSQIGSIVALEFTSNAIKLSQAPKKDEFQSLIKGLPPRVVSMLNRLFFQPGPFKVTLWFRSKEFDFKLNGISEMDRWAKHLQYQVNSHVPPCHQYQNKFGYYECGLDTAPTIKEIGGGMYCLYPKVRGKDDTTQVPQSYYAFRQKTEWETASEFGVTIAMPVVRDVQTAQAQASGLGIRPHLAMLVKAPSYPVEGLSSEVSKELSDVVYCYVRLLQNPGSNRKPKAPAVDDVVVLEWDNSIEGVRVHEPSKKKSDKWVGNVVLMEEQVNMSKTDFCVMLSVPRGATHNRHVHPNVKALSDASLAVAWLSIKIDTTAAQRDLEAAMKLASPFYEPETLGPIRQAFRGTPSTRQPVITDLTKRSPDWYDWWASKVAERCQDNPRQLEVVRRLGNIQDRLLAVVGPPGAGKTKSLADAVIAVVLQRYTQLVVGPSNKSVDQAANYVYNAFPKEQRDTFRFLRLEVNAAELRAMVAVKDYKTPDRAHPEAAVTVENAEATIENDDVLIQAMAGAVREYERNKTLLANLYHKTKDFKRALKQFRKRAERKASKVPASMTSGWHLFLLAIEDDEKATKELDMVKNAWCGPKKTDEYLASMVRDMNLQPGGEYWTAFASDALEEAEFNARVADGRIRGIAARDASFEYTTALDNYIKLKGKVDRDSKKRFASLWSNQMIRVFKRIDCLFTTCNNAGSGMLKLGFRPEVLACDEAGQVTMASLAVVLTSFTDWLAIMLFGDPKQLLPYSVAGMFNEFRNNSRVSSLGMLDEKNYHVLRLDVVYRVAPTIMQWVSKYFYSDLLRNHVSLTVDDNHPARAAGRKVSKQFYKLEGERPEKDGSELFVINVKKGISRLQQHGTSLTNFANAEVVAANVDRLLQAGLHIGEITVLTYYTGQKFCVFMKLREVVGDNGRTWEPTECEISSVDAYQGQESTAVILDIVVAHPHGTMQGNAPTEDDEFSEDEDSPLHTHDNTRHISAHVRDGHRLCCALTRAKDVLIVICQTSPLLATSNKTQSKARAALSEFIKDAYDRGLVVDEDAQLDTSPEGTALRVNWGEVQTKALIDSSLMEQEANLLTNLRKARKYKPIATTADGLSIIRGRVAKPPTTDGKGQAAEPKLSLQAIRDDPMHVTLIEATPVSQRGRKAKQKERQTAKAAKAAEAEAQADASSSKGKVIPLGEEEAETARAMSKRVVEEKEAAAKEEADKARMVAEEAAAKEPAEKEPAEEEAEGSPMEGVEKEKEKGAQGTGKEGVEDEKEKEKKMG
jgi:hypothetical protein